MERIIIPTLITLKWILVVATILWIMFCCYYSIHLLVEKYNKPKEVPCETILVNEEKIYIYEKTIDGQKYLITSKGGIIKKEGSK